MANPAGSGKGGEACGFAKASLGMVLKGCSSQTGMLPNPSMADLEHQYSCWEVFKDSMSEVGFWELTGLLLLLHDSSDGCLVRNFLRDKDPRGEHSFGLLAAIAKSLKIFSLGSENAF